MKTDKRLRRRAEKQKKVKRAKKLYPDNPNYQKYADNLTPCSCPMCGNPRKHWKGKTKFTVQELKSKTDEDTQWAMLARKALIRWCRENPY